MELNNSQDSVVADAIMESWERQTTILRNLCTRVGEDERVLKASNDGWPIDEHLCHIHESRYGWLTKVAPAIAASLGDVFVQNGDVWTPIQDLNEIKRQLALSGDAVGNAVREHLKAGTTKVGPYSHPIQFLQHMLWHEGYHFALITLALRLAGKECTEEWEEESVWGIWRS